MRALVLFGTRPEAVKMAPVVRALEAHPRFKPLVCVTAQHRQMLDQVMDLFELKAEVDLDVMRPDQDLGALSARILKKMGKVLDRLKPDLVLVQGDTTTTFCGALAAFYRKIPVGHVEAGLRTGDRFNPYPEEMNRLLTTRLATWHFAPTEHNRQALLKEGVADAQIFLTGNPVIDALHQVRGILDSGGGGDEVAALMARFSRPFLLITGHRRESFGQGFQNICEALRRIAKAHPELDLVYPVHLNPHVQKPVQEILAGVGNIHLLKPLGYAPFVALMNRCRFILTDSGGVQEEALPLGKPVLILRQTTERVEALESGGALLVGTDVARIVEEAERLLSDDKHFEKMSKAVCPFGEGDAAKRIIDVIHAWGVRG
ncbi:MAG: UDP-N-acetylglucosamine 2-epimerase (non-hydrolyzing) [Magnetococcales bacterium]|nr:UDP-N-acetylglucosamine 2-epimerase (non-hydrolyzing) [Magnetococcales bacterium]